MTRSMQKCKPKKKTARKSGKGAKKCSRPGPITNNAFFNYLRAYRKKHCGLKPRVLVSRAARTWNCLSEEKKEKYRRMALKFAAKQKQRSVHRKPKC